MVKTDSNLYDPVPIAESRLAEVQWSHQDIKLDCFKVHGDTPFACIRIVIFAELCGMLTTHSRWCHWIYTKRHKWIKDAKFGEKKNDWWVIVRTNSLLTNGHTHIHTHTEAMTTSEGQNWPRVKMATDCHIGFWAPKNSAHTFRRDTLATFWCKLHIWKIRQNVPYFSLCLLICLPLHMRHTKPI